MSLKLQARLRVLADRLVEDRVRAAVQRIGGVIRKVERNRAADGRVELVLNMTIDRREMAARAIESCQGVAGAVLIEVSSPAPDSPVREVSCP